MHLISENPLNQGGIFRIDGYRKVLNICREEDDSEAVEYFTVDFICRCLQ